MSQKKNKPNKQTFENQEAFDDERFQRITKDPRFIKPKKDDTKVKIDQRFAKMLEDTDFGDVPKVDKYGRRIKKAQGEDLKKYYKLERESEESESDEYDPARGKGVVASSSDSELESNADDIEIENEDDLFDRLGPFANEVVPEGDESKRLALVNMDWDNIKAADIFKVMESFAPKGGAVLSVKIYPSEFGKERLSKEAVEGPPKEIFADAEDEDIDEAVRKELFSAQDGSEFNQDKLREYQLERLRYYYAVIECDSIATARNIYQECDGAEFEKTSNFMDLRYVPDDMEFDDTPHDEASEAPVNYRPANFVTKALQQSNVQLTWDEDDRDRVMVTKRKFTKDDLKKMNFDAYVASSSDESDKEEMRNKYHALIGEEESEDDGGIEITFTPGLSEKAKELLDKRQDKIEKSQETVFEANRRKQKEKKKEKKTKGDDDFFKPVEKEAQKEELELLLDDNNVRHFDMKEVLDAEKKRGKKGKKSKHVPVQDDFNVDVKDTRFASMFNSPEFAIDPTNPSFKKTKNMEKLLEKRAEKAEKSEKKPSSKFDLLKSPKDAELSNLVASVKRKSNNSLQEPKKKSKH